MARIYKGRFETRRVGPRRYPRYLIGDELLRDEPSYYTGRGRHPWHYEPDRARLYHDRRDAESEILTIAGQEPSLALEEWYTLEVGVTAFGSPDREDVERLLRDALAVGLRRTRYRPDRTVVDSLVIVDPDKLRLLPLDEPAQEIRPDEGGAA